MIRRLTSFQANWIMFVMFLGASKRLYNRLRPSIGPLVGWTVRLPILLTSKLLCPRRARAWFEFLLFKKEVKQNVKWEGEIGRYYKIVNGSARKWLCYLVHSWKSQLIRVRVNKWGANSLVGSQKVIRTIQSFMLVNAALEPSLSPFVNQPKNCSESLSMRGASECGVV
jgi:hypothetical protein